MTNIIFTDIDGVLNPHWKTKWSKNAISIYNKMCKDFNLKPVITSTWRMSHTKEQLQKIFIDQGIEVEIYDYTQLPVMTSSGLYLAKERGREIKEWLDENKIDNYVVIDDKTSDIEPFVNNVIKCNSWIGLTEEHYNLVKEILNGSLYRG
jgi:histidinol phosphatase-like enzyme